MINTNNIWYGDESRIKYSVKRGEFKFEQSLEKDSFLLINVSKDVTKIKLQNLCLYGITIMAPAIIEEVDLRHNDLSMCFLYCKVNRMMMNNKKII